MEGSLHLALAAVAPESVEDDAGDSTSRVSLEVGQEAEHVEILPSQPPSTQRQVVSFGATEGYDFLSTPISLVVDAAPGCGGVTWPAALVLARFLSWHIHSDPSLATASFVELGAGTGILSIALAMMLRKETPVSVSPTIYATDLDFLIPLIDVNLALNGMQDSVKAVALPWGQEIAPDLPKRPNVILVADCVYFEPAFSLLVDTLCRLSRFSEGQPQHIFFCYQKRRKADKRFFNLLKKHFTWSDVADPSRHLYSRQPVYLFELFRKRL